MSRILPDSAGHWKFPQNSPLLDNSTMRRWGCLEPHSSPNTDTPGTVIQGGGQAGDPLTTRLEPLLPIEPPRRGSCGDEFFTLTFPFGTVRLILCIVLRFFRRHLADAVFLLPLSNLELVGNAPKTGLSLVHGQPT